MKAKELKEIIEEISPETTVVYELEHDTYNYPLDPGIHAVTFQGIKIEGNRLTIRLST